MYARAVVTFVFKCSFNVPLFDKGPTVSQHRKKAVAFLDDHNSIYPSSIAQYNSKGDNILYPFHLLKLNSGIYLIIFSTWISIQPDYHNKSRIPQHNKAITLLLITNIN